MLTKIGSLLLLLALPLLPAHSQDDPVRLPGQGELKSDIPTAAGLGRLIPGGGLLLSFDRNQDGDITQTEIDEGIISAFIKADANEDGRITPLEQIKWTESLPTRDVSLANPARFDPNLDRSVRNDEFTDIITAFAAIHMDETSGVIPVTALKFKDRKNRSRSGTVSDDTEERSESRRTQNRNSTNQRDRSSG